MTRRVPTTTPNGEREPLRPSQLSRADILLLLIEERSSDAGVHCVLTGDTVKIHRLSTPQFSYYTQVTGAGDRSALNSLLRKGLIELVHETGGYRVTDDGKLRAQTIA